MDPEEIVNIGTRLSYNLDLCTVRFVGRIPPWPVIAYGVEWDDPERCKHDGTLNGVRYFDCKFTKSTFILRINLILVKASSMELGRL